MSPRIAARDCAVAVRDLPSPPAVFQRLIGLLERPDWTMAAVANVIGSDQGMSARILRLANSPFYGLPRQVDFLEEAISLVGLIELRQLVLATSVIQHFQQISPEMVSPDTLRERAVRAAVMTAAIATRQGTLVAPRHAFLGGLFHDIGTLAVCQVMPEQARAALLSAPATDNEPRSVERMVFGTNTCDLGAALLQHWRLPDALADMVQWWPEPTDVQAPPEAVVLHAGVWLALAPEVAPGAESPIWHACGIDAQAITELAADCEPEITHLLAMT